jgi:soluble lytic murein transglycosylase-like protein
MVRLRAGTSLLVVLVLSPWAGRAESGAIRSISEGGRRIYVNGGGQATRREARITARRANVPGPPRVTKQAKPAAANLKGYADSIAKAYRIRPELVQAVIAVESGWDPLARSKKGALGLMQLMPETCIRFGVQDPFEPRENIRAGVQYLRLLLDRFDGDIRLALAAYNAGEKAIGANGRLPAYPETQSYVERVNEVYGRLARNQLFSSGQIYTTQDNHGRIIFTNY